MKARCSIKNAILLIQKRDYGGVGQGSGSEVVEMSNSVYIFKLVVTGFADRTELRCVKMRRIMGEIKTFTKVTAINSDGLDFRKKNLQRKNIGNWA